MGRRCCITSCNSNSRLPEHHGVTYHSFPLDPATRAIWIRNTRIGTDKPITKSVLVCSRHFRRADFQPQRSGKYLLKQRVFPTVFPWGKIDPNQVANDLDELRTTGATAVVADLPKSDETSEEDATKATVEATVAQIMAETAELNAAAGIKQTTTESEETPGVKFEPVTNFSPGVRLEAQDFDGIWHAARVVEVDNDDREVLLKFERSGKHKSNFVGTEEWIPMNSTRLRQKVSTRPILVFELEEKCLARWSGPRKFPGTVKKILGNDTYEVLFDDGYMKNVRAVHMNKFPANTAAVVGSAAASTPPALVPPSPTTPSTTASGIMVSPVQTVPKLAVEREGAGASSKKRSTGGRKDWPLLDLSKLDLANLNLPEIPRDGEWTCHWVNDQPIGREGFLIVGEHRKPTVVVEDWRLPPGWVKHMYQRSNLLGKWDVILVTPNGKRFRSKSDLKTYLEEQGQVYNPDIYDFSIHRRRAKDINAYVFTPDYVPQQLPKRNTASEPLSTNASISPSKTNLTGLAASGVAPAQFMEPPVATPLPPMELMTSPALMAQAIPTTIKLEPGLDGSLTALNDGTAAPATDPGFAYIGGLKVQIVDNLFRCPEEGCSKNFRKENHLQIHVKHYHKDLSKLLGECPKMQELAEKRTHTSTTDTVVDAQPKNQIPNQEFFAKLYQQDLQHARSRGGKSTGGATPTRTTLTEEIKMEPEIKTEFHEQSGVNSAYLNSTQESNTTSATEVSIIGNSTLNSTDATASTALLNNQIASPNLARYPASKRSRFPLSKRHPTSRKSQRQRTTRRYLTAAQASGSRHVPASMPAVTLDGTFGVSDFEETRHSFNATPDAKVLSHSRKRKALAATTAATHSISGLDSPMTVDSNSSSFQTLTAAGSSNEHDPHAAAASGHQQAQQSSSQYIKENGELIKIVRMRQEEIINCLCGYGEEDGLMIQCELCLCWQHGACNGIDKESEVPDKYVCYICRNPTRGRESMRYKHDQDWLYEGTLPTANYHSKNPDMPKRFEFLKKSHTLTGNLIEMKRFMHSLRVKINVANNRDHPKLYLWAKKWEEDKKPGDDIKVENASPSKRIKTETGAGQTPPLMPNIPQPEAPIDSVECQQRLIEHIKVQQEHVLERLALIEAEVDELERQDDLPDLKNADMSTTKTVLATFLKELDIMNDIAKINALENAKIAAKAQANY